jgi:hypothetical protein
MAEGQTPHGPAAPPNCVSRRASRTSTIAPPEGSTAPCFRSFRRANGSTPTTIHAIVDARGRPIAIEVTPGILATFVSRQR